MKQKILTEPRISMISAVAKESLSIGNENGGLPWRIPEDFKYFKEKTMGHPIIMGRKTFEEFPKLLPGRIHIVITKDRKYKKEDVIVVGSIEKAIEEAKKIDNEEIFIIGGAQIYKLGLPYADRLYLTFVDTDFESSVKFPDYSKENFEITSKKKSSDNNFSYEFVILDRK
jgi:dihydrofolate reductase